MPNGTTAPLGGLVEVVQYSLRFPPQSHPVQPVGRGGQQSAEPR